MRATLAYNGLKLTKDITLDLSDIDIHKKLYPPLTKIDVCSSVLKKYPKYPDNA